MLTRRTLLSLAAVGAPFELSAQCREVTLDQRTYRATGFPAHQGRVYLHTGDIEAVRSASGFKPFEVHIIVGLYRPPFLGASAALSEADREALLKGRSGLWRDKLTVTRPSGESKTFTPPGLPRFLLRVRQVSASERAVNRVVLEVCP